MVIGPKKFEFIALVLEELFTFPSLSSDDSSNNIKNSKSNKNNKVEHSSTERYINILKRFISMGSGSKLTNDSGKSVNPSLNITSEPTLNKTTTNSNKKKSSPAKKEKSSSHHSSEEDSEDYERSSLDEEALNIPEGQKKFCGMYKFVKMIETQSFWITLNFYLTDLKIYDPILSEFTRGNINIGIVVGNDESVEIDNIKHLLTGSGNPFDSIMTTVKDTSKTSRAENSIEAKINSRVHFPCVSGFNSLLCLRLREECRLVEESNNLRLTNNQIFRWIVDRYFENNHRIKLKESLGDEIERESSSKNDDKKENKRGCEIM